MKIQQEITLIPVDLRIDYEKACNLVNKTLNEHSINIFLSKKKPRWLDVEWNDYRWAVGAVQGKVRKEIRDSFDEGHNHIVIKITFDKVTNDLAFDIHRVGKKT